MRIAACAAAIAAIFMVARGDAYAQPSPAAEKLFRDGRKLLASGDIDRACEAFAASTRLEPSIGALLNLGDCREKQGKTATAWAAFVEAGNLAKRRSDKRRNEAERRASKLEERLSYLTIRVPTPGVHVTRDGKPVDAGTFGVALPIDPGPHELAAEGGGRSWHRDIVIGPTNDWQSVVVELEAEETPTTPAPTPAPSTIDDTPQAPRPEAPHRFTSLRIGALVVGVAGLGGLAGSIVLGLQARSLDDEAHTACPSGEPCRDPAAVAKSKDAVSKAKLATIVGGVGAAAVAAGVVMWIVGKPTPVERQAHAVPVVSSSGVGFAIVGAF